jgi:hypothetical protein
MTLNAATPKRQQIPRWQRWLLWFGCAFVAYSVVGFLVLPPIIKWQLIKRLPGITQRRATVRQVKVNPWTLSLTVRGLALNEPDGRPFVSWDQLYVNFQTSALFRWAWTFKEIRLVKPFGEIILLKDGRLNFSNMLEGPTNAPPKPSAPASVPRINIYHLEVTNGFVAIEDRTRRSVFRTEYRPININLRDFSTRPDSEAPYSFHAESDAGRSITWAGDLRMQPPRSSGHFEITAVRLPRAQPYLEPFTRAVVTNGLANVQLDYQFAADTNGLTLVMDHAALQVTNVQVLDPDTGEIVTGLRGLEVKQAGFNLREQALHIVAVKVSEVSLLTRLKKDGHLNLLDLVTLPPPATNPPPANTNVGSAGPPLTVALDEFAIEHAMVSFEDLTRGVPFRTELKPIEVSVKGFSTKPGVDARYSFHVATEAAEALDGAGSFSIDPLRSTGEVRVSAADVKKYLPYAEQFFRGKIIAGKVEVRVPYRFAQDTNGMRAGVTNLDVKLSALNVLMPENAEEVTRINEIGFHGVEASLEDRRGRVGLFKGDGGSVLLRRQKDGTINLLGLLAVSKTNVATAGSPPASTGEAGATNAPAVALGGWTLKVDEIQLTNYTLKVEDLALPKPAAFLLDQLALQVKGVSTVASEPVSANVAFRVNETGTIAASGTAKLAPLSSEVQYAISNLDLRPAQPYIDPYIALKIVSGALDLAGKMSFQTNDPAAPRFTFSGAVGLTNFATADEVLSKELVRWDNLALDGIEATLTPNLLKIDSIRLVRPKASLIIGADHRSNLSLILRTNEVATNAAAASQASATAPTNSSAELFSIQLGTLALDQASLGFADESVQPPAVIGIEELSGTIKGLSSTTNTPAEVDLTGKVGAQSTFSIRGQVNPFRATRLVDLTFTNANTQLAPLTGYMEKYGGYPLKKGHLSTGLSYHIAGMDLKAQNKIQVDQLTLGAHNNSPDATKLPVKLGLALLKDSNGRIELDVPIEGRLDQPDFKVGRTILTIVMNMIVKAAASPFKLLGALVGTGGEELSFVEFVPGSTNLVEGELGKLSKLSTALGKRPALDLSVEGAVDPKLDRDALARQELSDQLKTNRLQELTAKGAVPESVSTFQIEPEARERLLRAMFVEQFGTNISGIIQTNLARLMATNQPAATTAPKPKRSLVERLTGLFGADSTGPSKAEKRLPKADREALGLATPELMEELLAERVQVSEDELRRLMSARAGWVQDWLVQTGHVAADRVLVEAPKPLGTNYQGQRRVMLSLE